MLELDIETHPLTPFLPQNAKLLMLGSFPPPQNKWKMNFYYPNFQNDMWRIFGLIYFNDKNYFLDVTNKNFKEQLIQDFLNQTGIGIFDTAYQVKRLQGNASDKFLEIVTPTDLSKLLEQIPLCHNIITTGDKATETLCNIFLNSVINQRSGNLFQWIMQNGSSMCIACHLHHVPILWL